MQFENGRIVCTTKELADLFEVDQRRVNQLAQTGEVKKVGRGVCDLLASVKGYLNFLRSRGALEEVPEGELDPRRERARLHKAQADKVELENAVNQGTFVHIDEVRQLALLVGVVCNTSLDAIPGRLAGELAAQLGVENAQIYDILQTEVLKIRQQISDGLQNLSNPARTQSPRPATAEAGGLEVGGTAPEITEGGE